MSDIFEADLEALLADMDGDLDSASVSSGDYPFPPTGQWEYDLINIAIEPQEVGREAKHKGIRVTFHFRWIAPEGMTEPDQNPAWADDPPPINFRSDGLLLVAKAEEKFGANEGITRAIRMNFNVFKGFNKAALGDENLTMSEALMKYRELFEGEKAVSIPLNIKTEKDKKSGSSGKSYNNVYAISRIATD